MRDNREVDVDPIAGIKAKLSRANTHLAEVERLAFDFMNSEPTRVSLKARPETQDYVASVRVTPVPLELAVAFGDAVQNLRATLDYMARALVVADGRDPKDGGRGSTQFPIHLTLPARPLAVHPGISDDALAIIERVQPYKSLAPDKHPLWRLQELSNHDKHRLLHVTAISGSYLASILPMETTEQVILTPETVRYPIPLVDGHTEVIRPRDGYVGLARLGGEISYTVVLGDSDASWSEQLSLLVNTIKRFLISDVLIPLSAVVERDSSR